LGSDRRRHWRTGGQELPDGLIGVHLLQIFAYPSGDPAEMAKLSEADKESLSGTTADFQSKGLPEDPADAAVDARIRAHRLTRWAAHVERRAVDELGRLRRLPRRGHLPDSCDHLLVHFRTIRTFAERANNIVRYSEFDRGGHFAYTADPDLVVADLREFLASLS